MLSVDQWVYWFSPVLSIYLFEKADFINVYIHTQRHTMMYIYTYIHIYVYTYICT